MRPSVGYPIDFKSEDVIQVSHTVLTLYLHEIGAGKSPITNT
jgi:hypothetical protein